MRARGSDLRYGAVADEEAAAESARPRWAVASAVALVLAAAAATCWVATGAARGPESLPEVRADGFFFCWCGDDEGGGDLQVFGGRDVQHDARAGERVP
mmetsp:Transcript_2246/g.8151  ORF Transcript_2246/g.8151 Transcript_2246/m.8151 type:complete len:99 (+) Transcript_2246:62-358(+)